MVATYNQRVHG